MVELLRAGADPNARPAGGRWSALNFAVENSNPWIVRLLLDGGARPSAKSGVDPLAQAVGGLKVEIVKLLLPYNTERDFKRDPEYGRELMRLAASRQSHLKEQVVRSLIEAGADPSALPPTPETPRGEGKPRHGRPNRGG